MNIKELNELLPVLVKTRVPLMLEGDHGLGKSQVLKQWALKNGFRFVDLRLGSIDTGELMGLMDYVDDPKTGKRMAHRYLKPSWFPKDGEKVFVFLDEWNRAKNDVLQGIFQLTTDYKMGEYELTEGSYVCAANNPADSDSYIVNAFEDAAFHDRFCNIKFTPTEEEWTSYARSVEMNSDLIEFCAERPEMIKSRRTRQRISDVMNANLPSTLMFETIAGMTDITVSTTFKTWLDNNRIKPISIEDTLGKSFSSKLSKIIKSNRNDLIALSHDNIVDALVKEYNSEQVQLNVMTYIDSIPADMVTTFITTFQKAAEPAIKANTKSSDRIAQIRIFNKLLGDVVLKKNKFKETA